MSKLFASHLLHTTKASSPIEGHYDPGQELWVADNLLRGSVTTHYQTRWIGATNIWNGCGWTIEEDEESDPDEDEV